MLGGSHAVEVLVDSGLWENFTGQVSREVSALGSTRENTPGMVLYVNYRTQPWKRFQFFGRSLGVPKVGQKG